MWSTAQEVPGAASLSQPTNAYTWVIYFVPEELMTATWAQEKRHQAEKSGAFNCWLSLTINDVLTSMLNNELCNNPAQTKSCICRVVSALRLTPGFFTLPPLTMLREWISPPRIHVPARIWDELRCPSLPSPKAEQRLSWGHLCSKRHISKNVPNHRVLTMLCFCCTEPRLYRFPAFKIH